MVITAVSGRWRSPAVQYGWLRSVAVGKAGNRDIIIAGTLKGAVQAWDASTGEPLGLLLVERSSPALAVAIGRAADRDVIVSGDANGAVRLWDATTFEQVSRPLTAHTDWVLAVAIGRAGDRDIIISGSRDRAVFVHAHRATPLSEAGGTVPLR